MRFSPDQQHQSPFPLPSLKPHTKTKTPESVAVVLKRLHAKQLYSGGVTDRVVVLRLPDPPRLIPDLKGTMAEYDTFVVSGE